MDSIKVINIYQNPDEDPEVRRKRGQKMIQPVIDSILGDLETNAWRIWLPKLDANGVPIFETLDGTRRKPMLDWQVQYYPEIWDSPGEPVEG